MRDAYIISLLSAVGILCSTTCGRIDGLPVSGDVPGLSACTRDLDCGPGRYCGGQGVCALDCVTSKDCAFTLVDPKAPNRFDCSPCGRCLPPDTRDATCIAATDIPCVTDGDCGSTGGGAVCAPAGFCAPVCRSDDDCRESGRGWACSDGLCKRRCFRDLDCLFHGWNFECVLPPGVDKTANAETDDPAFGECLPRVGGVDWGPTGSPGTGAEYRGVWGMLYTAACNAVIALAKEKHGWLTFEPHFDPAKRP